MKENQTRYLSSELSEYINVHCPRNHTTTDIDLTQWRINSNGQTIRLIEYKHSSEGYGKMQKPFLKQFAKMLKFMMNNYHFQKYYGQYKLETVIIRGDSPFDEIEITDLMTDEIVNLKQPQVKYYLSFVYDPFKDKYMQCCPNMNECRHFKDDPVYFGKLLAAAEKKGE